MKPAKLQRLVDSNFPNLDSISKQILGVYLTGETGGWTEEGRRELGRIVFNNFLDGSTYDEAANKLSQHWADVGPMPDWFWTLTATPANVYYSIDMAGWYEVGFPKVVVEGEYGSALMATRLTDEIVESIIPPWPYFMIEVKDTPLVYRTKHGKEFPVNQLFVRSWKDDAGEINWTLTALCGTWEVFNFYKNKPSSFMISMTEKDVIANGEAMLANKGSTDDEVHRITGISGEEMGHLIDINARMSVASMRLVAGICLAMSDPANVKRGKPKFAGIIPKHLRGLPVVREFLVGKPLSLKCRAAMTDWVAGREGKSPSVQVLVRGHWKRQAHGPNMSLRKTIHVEPYWRGPEDAPINVRPHVLEE